MHIITSASIEGSCTPHASTVGESVWKQLDRALSVSYADTVIYQSNLPYVITKAGSYGVGENLTSIGTTTMITIAPDVTNVWINLHEHSITSTVGGDTAIAILSAGNRGVIVENGVITGFNIGVYRATWVKNMIISQCATGISGCRYVNNCSGYNCNNFFSIIGSDTPGGTSGRLFRCDIFNTTDYAVVLNNGVVFFVIDQCNFFECYGGIITNGTVRSPKIFSSSFQNITENAITCLSGGNFLNVRNCNCTACTNGIVNLGINGCIIDTIISNCSGVGIDFGDSTGAGGTIYRNTISNANIGIRAGTIGTSLAVYNNYISDAAITFSGFSASKATPSQIASSANFWTNIVD